MVQRISRGQSDAITKKLAAVSAVAEKVRRGEPVKAVQPKTTENLDITGTVSVACNCPNGLLLRVHREVKNRAPRGPNGMEPDSVWHPDQSVKPVRVRGPNIGRGADAGNVRHVISGGYAITRNVPKNLWLRWLEENKESPLVLNRMVFACNTTNEAESETMKEANVSGFEPLDPEAAPKEMKTGRKKHLKMQMADDE